MNEKDKKEILFIIENRINSEFKKHKELDWAKIAAYKIFSSLFGNSITELNPFEDISISKELRDSIEKENDKIRAEITKLQKELIKLQ